jgi:tRNA A37 threonylcarbamoyladenosine dehydratase
MTSVSQEIFARTERLVGPAGMARLQASRVILFGVGGVGGWCAEALIRSGIGHLTLVDPDVVDVTNVNRQLPATTKTIGLPKVEVLRDRLLEINPLASIVALRERYDGGTLPSPAGPVAAGGLDPDGASAAAGLDGTPASSSAAAGLDATPAGSGAATGSESRRSFRLEEYDYIIDAIDSLSDKMNLLLEASAAPGKLFCSLGAACKVDPTKVRVAEFFSVRGCPLGAALRKKMRQQGRLPAKPFLCVYDDEVLPNLGPAQDPGPGKAIANGTLAPITGLFGFTLAGLVVQDILSY